jgi:hypothetical protein
LSTLLSLREELAGVFRPLEAEAAVRRSGVLLHPEKAMCAMG